MAVVGDSRKPRGCLLPAPSCGQNLTQPVTVQSEDKGTTRLGRSRAGLRATVTATVAATATVTVMSQPRQACQPSLGRGQLLSVSNISYSRHAGSGPGEELPARGVYGRLAGGDGGVGSGPKQGTLQDGLGARTAGAEDSARPTLPPAPWCCGLRGLPRSDAWRVHLPGESGPGLQVQRACWSCGLVLDSKPIQAMAAGSAFCKQPLGGHWVGIGTRQETATKPG